MSLSLLHERHKKGKGKRKKNKPSTSITSFQVRAGFDCQSEACVCICTRCMLWHTSCAVISRVSTCRVEVVSSERKERELLSCLLGRSLTLHLVHSGNSHPRGKGTWWHARLTTRIRTSMHWDRVSDGSGCAVLSL